jgi:GNAT superfamily N-acetyltransferase
MLDDPTRPTIYRVSGQPPFPEPFGPLPHDIAPRQVTLRDRVTTATLLPFSSPLQVPPRLIAYLAQMLNREIEKGDTYPMMEPLPEDTFGPYWFANFGAVMVMGDLQSVEEVSEMEERGVDWAKECLGSFYVKPNYPGRSSHVCNGGFLVTDAARNRGVGRLMGEGYLEWAPKLGYTYSVFNLVYETNVASLRIWDALGFKRIGRVKDCGNLKSYPDQYIDAIIFGRELGGEGDEYISEERFDKIRFYLKNGTYPNGSDRAEKSRLRSAATHYRLIPNLSGDGEDDKLMLKGKEVVSDPHKQYEIARNMHAASHGGINKTTASIADKYHWVRIKETVSAAIRNCTECKDSVPKSETPSTSTKRRATSTNAAPPSTRQRVTVTAGSDDAVGGASPLHQQQLQPAPQQVSQQHQGPAPTAPMAPMQYPDNVGSYSDMPVDPQIMQSLEHWNSNAQNGMDMDGGNDGSKEAREMDADARLRETLEAQLMSHDEYERQVDRENAQALRNRYNG